MNPRRAIATGLATTALALSACSTGAGDSGTGDGSGRESADVVAGLLRSADGDEVAAIVGTLVAADRGYTLEQLGGAAVTGTFDAGAGAITKRDGYAHPLGEPQHAFVDAPALGDRATSGGAVVVVPAVAVQVHADVNLDQAATATRTFLETEPEALLSGLGTDSKPAPAASPDTAPVAVQEGTHLTLILVLLAGGYSPEQVVSALILGEVPACQDRKCTLSGEPPLLPEQGSFIDVLLGVETDPQSSVAGTWSGKLNYTDDTITLKMDTNQVIVTRDADGVFTMKATLTYRTIPNVGDCVFDWTKEFEGTGNLDPTGTSIDFRGVEGVSNTSTCADANTIDRVMEVSRRVTVVDGNTLEGVVATGEFSITGPQIS